MQARLHYVGFHDVCAVRIAHSEASDNFYRFKVMRKYRNVISREEIDNNLYIWRPAERFMFAFSFFLSRVACMICVQSVVSLERSFLRFRKP